VPDPIPALLPTTGIGSYPLPRWLEHARELPKSGTLTRALRKVPADRLWLNPDCGLKFTRRAVAWAKLRAMTAGAALARAELSCR